MKTKITGTINIKGKKYYKVHIIDKEDRYKSQKVISQQECNSCALYYKNNPEGDCEMECLDNAANYFIKYEDRKDD